LTGFPVFTTPAMAAGSSPDLSSLVSHWQSPGTASGVIVVAAGPSHEEITAPNVG